ncbi:MAG: hypothetical protein HY273_11315 [Gammaproteobacteria bacterium]|nr:hypothetical protein [Gammaproteobacteria bacterium]
MTKCYEDIDQFIALEHARIAQRRAVAQVEPGNPSEDAVGLALSGGGIRSATFNLGMLQAMHRFGFLRRVDYLSTVSGGGYIGSSLTWLMSRCSEFPFGTRRSDHNKAGGDLISWLREHANYLTPGDGLDRWALAAAVLRGIFINLLILVPLFFSVMYFMVQTSVRAPGLLHSWPDSLFTWLFALGLICWEFMAFGFMCYALCSGFKLVQHAWLRKRANVILGRLLKAGVALVVLGSLPLVQQFVEVRLWPQLFGAENYSAFSVNGTLSLLSGAAAVWAGWSGRSRTNEAQGMRALLLSAGLGLLLYGLVLWLYNGAFLYYAKLETWWRFLIYPGLILSFIFGVLANINHVSMHRYYRDRLLAAFLPAHPHFTQEQDPNRCYLKDLKQTAAPYHIINTNLLTLDSPNSKRRARGADNFIFSPLVCGSSATGFAPTDEYLDGTMNLATALTISGAAVNPNTGVTRSRSLAAVMTLFNARLGYWTRNPRHPPKFKLMRSRPLWHTYALREMLGLRMDENCKHVHLSDGGHFENLALYELIRRKCRYIVVCDAAADPTWSFADLVNVIEKVRVDFGAAIDIDTRPLRPQGDTEISAAASVTGRIRYVDGTEARLLYVNTSLISGLSEDIYGYHRAHSSFPDEPTADQFFDETQFEAYRELGYQIGRCTFEGKTLLQTFA